MLERQAEAFRDWLRGYNDADVQEARNHLFDREPGDITYMTRGERNALQWLQYRKSEGYKL